MCHGVLCVVVALSCIRAMRCGVFCVAGCVDGFSTLSTYSVDYSSVFVLRGAFAVVKQER